VAIVGAVDWAAGPQRHRAAALQRQRVGNDRLRASPIEMAPALFTVTLSSVASAISAVSSIPMVSVVAVMSAWPLRTMLAPADDLLGTEGEARHITETEELLDRSGRRAVRIEDLPISREGLRRGVVLRPGETDCGASTSQ